MTRRPPALLSGLVACLVAPFLAGCAPEIGGRASFPVLAKGSLSGFERVAEVDEKRCTHVVLFFFGWGDDSNHEALVTDLLEQHKGDAIENAELTFFSIPALVYNQSCARVRGTVVRRAGGGAAPVASPPAPAAHASLGAEVTR